MDDKIISIKNVTKISIICIYNNFERLNESLIKSLNSFKEKSFELVLVDNRQHAFGNAADALNYGAKKATGEILLFSHQDLYIKDEKEFYDFARFIETNDKSVVGVAGAVEKQKINYTNCTSGEKLNINTIDNNREIKKVSCIDECFFGLTKDSFLEHNFDSTLCDDWHLYAVEMSLYARKYWRGVYAYPIQCHHFSNGKITKNYWRSFIKVADAYRNDFKYIWTCCYKVRNNWIFIRSLCLTWYLYRLFTGNFE